MARTSAPLWLASPSRFAGIARNRAIVALVAIVLAALMSLTALIGPKPITQDPNPPPGQAERADVLLYESIVAAVRNGGNYYRVAADAQRLGGYPVRPFITMRLPTLAVIQAALPPVAVVLLLWALIAATATAWTIRLRPAFARSIPHVAAIALLACGLLVYANRDILWFHEIWSGVLIALSLALWRPGHATTAIAVAACAMLIRETAALYAIIMALAALRDKRRREALGWGVALALLAAAVAAHHFGWSNVAKPDDPVGPGWSGLLGIGFAITTIAQLTALSALPLSLTAPLIALALAGWASWNDPLATRVLAVLVAYLALLAIFCRADTYYWGLSIAALVPLGLAFALDGIRDLATAALDRRRITVTRAAR